MNMRDPSMSLIHFLILAKPECGKVLLLCKTQRSMPLSTHQISYDREKMSRTSFILPIQTFVFILLPAMLSLGLILHFAVDVPKEDEWITPGFMFQHIIEGSLTTKDFFSQHFEYTESRDAFPRLIFLLFGLTLGWHVTVIMVLSWFCVVGTFLFILRILPGAISQCPKIFFPISLLLGALLFSPSQWENQLWGIQLIFFIPPLCLAMGLWFQSTRASYGLKVIMCAVLSMISTFSYPNGMACWLLAAPFFRTWFTEWPESSPRERVKVLWWTILYVSLAVATMVFYFWEFVWAPVPYGLALKDPGLGLKFFVALVGSPLSQYASDQVFAATLVGIGVLLMALFSLGVIVRQWMCCRDVDLVTTCYPWICLFGYGVLSSLAVTSGRANWGLEAALVSAYTSVSLWVSIGLVGIVCGLWNFHGLKTRAGTNITFGLSLGILFFLTFFSWVDGIGQMQLENVRAEQRLLNLRLLPVIPSNPLDDRHRPWLDPKIIRDRFMLFIDHGLLQIETIGPWITERVQAPEPGDAGRFTIAVQSDEHIYLSPEEVIRDVKRSTKVLQIDGWAMLPDQGVPADFVILGKRDEAGSMRVITGFVTKVKRPDIVMAQNNPRLLLSGFSDTLDSTFLENPQFFLFAVDLKNQRVYGLKQDAT